MTDNLQPISALDASSLSTKSGPGKRSNLAVAVVCANRFGCCYHHQFDERKTKKTKNRPPSEILCVHNRTEQIKRIYFTALRHLYRCARSDLCESLAPVRISTRQRQESRCPLSQIGHSTLPHTHRHTHIQMRLLSRSASHAAYRTAHSTRNMLLFNPQRRTQHIVYCMQFNAVVR